MGRRFNPAAALFAIAISLTCFSCSSSRYQQGFSYQPAYAGPDVAAGQAVENQEEPGTAPSQGQAIELNLPPTPESAIKVAEPSEVLAGIITREYLENQQQNKEVNTRETIHKMAAEYAATTHKELTGKQLRKLDRYAAKMEKKQRRGAEDINWGPSNNLEWFVLLGAGVGLVVGILGIGFGWFVFLGLALVYLYFKLLKNN